jgi:hypothetical protein
LNVTQSGLGSISLSWKPPLENRGGVLQGFYVYYQKYADLQVAPTVWLKTSSITASQTSYNLVGLDQNI